MTFDELKGQSKHLAEEMRSGKGVHAYLFTGPAGTGKRTLADLCARTLLCAAPPSDRPCGHCPACQQYLSENHPDAMRLSSEKSIGVDALRALLEAISVRTYEGGRRVVLIFEAEKMTAQAQNAFLKTLEEPPTDTVFFLTTDTPSALLDTIRSRVRLVRLSPLSEEEATEVLVSRGITHERARMLARLSQGAVGKALYMDQSEGYWKLRSQVVAALVSLRHASDVAIAALSLKADRAQAEEMLSVMELWARDLMALQNAGEAAVLETDLVEKLAAQSVRGEDMLLGVFEARRRLASNVSWQSVAEMLFFEIAGGKNHGDSGRNPL